MKKILIILLLVVGSWQCSKKAAEGDLAGKEYIRGRLFLYDQLTQNADGIALATKKVTIGYVSATDTLNYLFSTTTDTDGYFVFSNLTKGVRYRVYYEETIANVLYKASAIVEASMDTLHLNAFVALTGQKGFHITAVDPNGAILTGVSLCVFTSALADGYTNNVCDGNNFKLTTDLFGHASKFSLLLGNYYINSSIDINGIHWASKDTVKVADGVTFDTIHLNIPNGFQITVLDGTGSVVPNASVCVFTDPLTAGYISNNCDGSNFKLTSDASGRASKYGLTAGLYYVNTSIDFNGMSWSSKDTIIVNTTDITSDTIRVKRPNGMEFTLLDSVGTILPNASICVFTSLALYQRDTCEGNNFQLMSSTNGEASRYNLAAQRYYIYSTLINGKFIWVARDTMDLTDQIVHHTLILRKKY